MQLTANEERAAKIRTLLSFDGIGRSAIVRAIGGLGEDETLNSHVRIIRQEIRQLADRQYDPIPDALRRVLAAQQAEWQRALDTLSVS